MACPFSLNKQGHNTHQTYEIKQNTLTYISTNHLFVITWAGAHQFVDQYHFPKCTLNISRDFILKLSCEQNLCYIAFNSTNFNLSCVPQTVDHQPRQE